MLTTSCYPVVMTDDVVGTVAFYQEFFPFQPAFAIDWYVHLTWQGDSGVNLAVMDGQHDSIPASHRGTVSGLILNFEVEDVDAEYARLAAAGLPIVQDLRASSSASVTFSRKIPTAC